MSNHALLFLGQSLWWGKQQMKLKNPKWLASLLLLLGIKGKALSLISGIIIGCVVVIVGGIILYKLYKFFHSAAWINSGNPDGNNGTNNVVTNNVTIDAVNAYGSIAQGYGQATQEITGTLSEVVDLSTNDIPIIPGAFASPLQGGFTLTYGLDLNTNPWITNGVISNPYVNVVQNDGTNFTFVLTGFGLGNGTLSFSSTNMFNTNDSSETDVELYQNGGALSVTNSYGDVASYTAPATNLETVIVMRSTNLVTWTPIFTNYIPPGDVEIFTDPQIFLPTEVTYYNTDTNGGGIGFTPPGDTNNVGTNGVYYIPGQAFYRLAYVTNSD